MTPDRKRLFLVNGPNLNLLGTREPALYGTATLADVEGLAIAAADDFGLEMRTLQSNHEGVLIDAIHESRLDCCGVVINPGAFTHTSIAIADALAAVGLPVAEVHLTNIGRRESFRHQSYVSNIADMVVTGAGVCGYQFAVQYLANKVGASLERVVALRHSGADVDQVLRVGMQPLPRVAAGLPDQKT
jgi:3-dehydroquinate dehydratase-2